jgi:magnesium-transporting ATPase (P-type)
MTVALGSIDHLAQVISQAVAPSFLLGAVVGFISILFVRMNTVLDRIRSLNAMPDDDDPFGLKRDIPRLSRRVSLLHWSTLAAIGAGATVTILIVMAFAFALVGRQHIWSSAVLFVTSLTFVCVSLVILAADVVVALSEMDHH